MTINNYKINYIISLIFFLLIAFPLISQNSKNDDQLIVSHNDDRYLLYNYLQVSEINTTLEVLLDGLDSNSFDSYNLSLEDSLNITAIYKDSSDIFIENATVELTGSGITRTFTPHDIFNQYNLSLNTDEIGLGVHFLEVSAVKENYSTSIVYIKLNVVERKAYLELFIDSNNLTSSKYIAAEVDRVLNITVFYKDFIDDTNISGANLTLNGALRGNLTENGILKQYNTSINTNNLNMGINFLMIAAQKENYTSESIIFTVEVIELASNLQLFLNGVNKTLDPSIQATIGDLINITAIYEDYLGSFIDNAALTLIGGGLTLHLTKHPVYNQYNISLNTMDLEVGMVLLTLNAQKASYQPQGLQLVIEVLEREMEVNVYLNGVNKTIDPRLTIPIRSMLNITIECYDLENDDPITATTVQIIGEGLPFSLNLTENPLTHQYSIYINTSLLDLGSRLLIVNCLKLNYHSYSTFIGINVNRIRTNITTISGENVFNLKEGDDFQLQIRLIDLDFGNDILYASITYNWEFGQGYLIDNDNDGIYETVISGVPVGLYQIEITTFAGDDYEFERLTITLNVIEKQPEIPLFFIVFQIIFISSIIISVNGLGFLIIYPILRHIKKRK